MLYERDAVPRKLNLQSHFHLCAISSYSPLSLSDFSSSWEPNYRFYFFLSLAFLSLLCFHSYPLKPPPISTCSLSVTCPLCSSFIFTCDFSTVLTTFLSASGYLHDPILIFLLSLLSFFFLFFLLPFFYCMFFFFFFPLPLQPAPLPLYIWWSKIFLETSVRQQWYNSGSWDNKLQKKPSFLDAEHAIERTMLQAEKHSFFLQSTKELMCADTAPSYGAEQKEEWTGGSLLSTCNYWGVIVFLRCPVAVTHTASHSVETWCSLTLSMDLMH